MRAIRLWATPMDAVVDVGELIESTLACLPVCSLRECQNTRVVQYHGAYLQDLRLWIAMEYCLCSMHSVLRSTNQPFTEAQIAAVCCEVRRLSCELN